MLQRIQSVYTAIALVLIVIANFLSFASGGPEGELNELSLTSLSTNGEVTTQLYDVIGIQVAAIVLAVLTLLKFSDRKLQMKLGKATMALFLGVTGSAFMHVSAVGEDTTLTYGPAVALPLVSAVLMFLAVRAIKKDDELVRSADRLR